MPYFLPSAAPTGCRVTKKAKKSATAVFMSPLSSPISVVKCADSAFPIYSAISDQLLFVDIDSTNICLIQCIEEEQQGQKGKKQAIELQQRPPMQPEINGDYVLELISWHCMSRSCRSRSFGELVRLLTGRHSVNSVNRQEALAGASPQAPRGLLDRENGRNT
jgi:hypothetical protein